VTNSKPDPEIFLKAAKACNTHPKNCLVLEDSAAGTEGGFRAGMRVITIPDMLPPSDETRQQATMVCNDLLEVLLYFDTQTH
jgi:beta-phosphoglucomutase-like phosphatase (HAD superfamily)